MTLSTRLCVENTAILECKIIDQGKGIPPWKIRKILNAENEFKHDGASQEAESMKFQDMQAFSLGLSTTRSLVKI